MKIPYIVCLFIVVVTVISCSHQTDSGDISEVKTFRLTPQDQKAILAAISGYESTNNLEIISSDDWGKNNGVTEYRIVVDNPKHPDEPRSYWLTKKNGSWKVASRQL